MVKDIQKKCNIEKSNDLHFPMRLQVFLAKSGVGSRRACEKYIEDGLVCVNGTPVTVLGAKVSKTDTVTYCGNTVSLEQKHIYVLLYKPKGYVCAAKDPFGRPLAVNLLQQAYNERIYNVGRLDMHSSGAIFFTNDGNFAKTISHPSSEIEKEYLVETVYPFDEHILEEFLHGKLIDGIFYRCTAAQKINEKKMRITLIEGKNREIRRVLASYNIQIRRLIRIRIGNIELGNLKPGQFRELTKEEVNALLIQSSKMTNSERE